MPDRMPWLYRIPLILVLWVALVFLIAGLTKPMIRFEQFWVFSDTVSLWGGTMTLLRSGETFLGVLGKWSMLDVFVIAILIVSARMDGITEARLLSGLYYFIVSVLLVNAVSTIFTWAPRVEIKAV